jgi:AraC-like DNA-binding protein
MITSALPHAALRPFVRFYYGAAAQLGEKRFVQPVPARSPQIIEFMFGTHYRAEWLDLGHSGRVDTIALVGARTRPCVNLHLTGTVDAFTIAFEPGGLHALFGMPAIELTDLDYEGGTVFGRPIDELHERLAQQGGFSGRVAVANDFLLARRPDFNGATPLIRAARQVHARSGCIAVADLAERTGLGLRQFERRFRNEIGMPPKLYARVVRFERALRLKAMSPALSWTHVAHDLGYHDQMHMVHDFICLSGESPTRIQDSLDMFVSPEVHAAGLSGAA